MVSKPRVYTFFFYILYLSLFDVYFSLSPFYLFFFSLAPFVFLLVGGTCILGLHARGRRWRRVHHRQYCDLAFISMVGFGFVVGGWLVQSFGFVCGSRCSLQWPEIGLVIHGRSVHRSWSGRQHGLGVAGSVWVSSARSGYCRR
jgi:hypothetical protein